MKGRSGYLDSKPVTLTVRPNCLTFGNIPVNDSVRRSARSAHKTDANDTCNNAYANGRSFV